MTERIQCEFFLLRYVPDAVKNEFVNIGVMLREAGRTETTQRALSRAIGAACAAWTRMPIRALLEAMEGELAARVRDGGSRDRSR